MDPLTIVFFGKSGAGKGTQIELLREKLKEKDLSRKILDVGMGNLLREFAKGEGYTNHLVASVIGNGGLLPSFMPVYLTGKFLSENFTGEEHVIFDGTTRRVQQSALLDSALRFYDRNKYYVISLDISNETAIERMQERARTDDTRKNMEARLEWYDNDVIPALEEFNKYQGAKVHHINGERTIEEIHEEVISVLGLE